MNIFDFDVTKENGETYKLSTYQGDVILIVNTATKCGLAPQFEELETLYQTYKDQGFIVLGFPSNQFKQEVSSAKEAGEACRIDYGVTFPMHQITIINGPDAHPLFDYLTRETAGPLGKSIKWNFTKFLINRDATVIERFAPTTSPLKIAPKIDAFL